LNRLSIEDILDNIHSKKLNANQGKIQDVYMRTYHNHSRYVDS
jgi:hypothetical protein